MARRYSLPIFAWLAVLVLAAGDAKAQPGSSYAEIPFDQSFIMFEWPGARTGQAKALRRESNNGVFDVVMGSGDRFKYFILLLQADPGVTVEKKGLYAPERILEISGIYDPDSVQWGDTGDVDASFAELATARFRAPDGDCVAFGSTFAPTARVRRSKEMLGMFCATGEAPLDDGTIRAVAGGLGVRGYAVPAGN